MFQAVFQLVATLLLALVGATASAADVLAIAYRHPDGGGYNRTWAGSGTPDAVVHEGRQVLAAGQGGTYCCGYTFAVAMQTLADRDLLDGKPYDAVKRFQKLWYGATELDDDTLCTLAVETLGVGRAVPLDEAQPGDFVQLWRTNGSGHSVIFLDWAVDVTSGDRVGFRYRSSQGSTDGIADATEYFAGAEGVTGGRVLREKTYACRLAD
ncbi:MAG: hypothetical protein AAFV43_16615 [Planctomycetota bacterium]